MNNPAQNPSARTVEDHTKATFRIALTGDFFENGEPAYPDFDLAVLDDAPGIEYAAFAERHGEIEPDQLAGFQSVIVLSTRVTAHSLSRSEELLAISRFGVGYDSVDVAACTDANVVLCISSGAVDRPVAEATVGWMLALAYRTRVKDQIARNGRWDRRSGFIGSGLRGRTLGVIGLGGIGRTVLRLLESFEMNRPLVFDPLLDEQAVAELGGEKATLPELMARSDFITVHCPLHEGTKDLISAPELELMKPSAFLLNTARGGIVNEDALFAALSDEQIAGAALDCFVEEPFNGPPRFAELENVILAPHNIAWTEDLFRDIGQMACQSLIDLAHGRRPRGVVNPEVFDRPSFQEKWEAVRLPGE